MEENIIPWVEGNYLSLAVTLYDITPTLDGEGQPQYDSDGNLVTTSVEHTIVEGDTVEVNFVGNHRHEPTSIRADVGGSEVVFADNGTLPKGKYGIEVRLVRAGESAKRGRWMQCGMVEIFRSSEEAGLTAAELIDADAISLGGVPFIAIVGERGEQGVQGAQGETGVGIESVTQNADYTLTITLTDGSAYTTGNIRGEQGEQGLQGIQGVQGIQGERGIQGEQGVQGERGEQGEQGEQGNGISAVRFNADYTMTLTFDNGTSWSTPVPIRGEQGERGENGTNGTNGVDGAQGERGIGISSTTLNADYTLTITYTDGATYTTPSIRGAQGAQGIQGETGSDGADGVGIAATALNPDYTLTITYTNGLSYTTPSIRGAKGEQGEAGTTDFNDLENVPTTIAGYGITDAKIENGVVTLGSDTITPITTHQDISGKEDTSNKVTAMTSQSTDTQYPSAKCVHDALSAKADTSSLATVATSGSYNDLSNTPTIPVGIPAGGNAGQIIKKTDGSTDYAVAWADQTSIYTSGYSVSGASRNPKVVSLSSWTATPNTYFMMTLGVANSVADAITLNVSSTGAKPVYINGTASSASNYTIPAGSYIVFYDGTNYYLRTDGKIPGPDNTTLALSSDISGKEDKMSIVAGSGTALTAVENTAYTFADAVGTLAVTLPTPSDTTHVSTIVFWFTTSASPAVTFTSDDTVYYHDGYSIEASTTYEVNAAYNGSNWVISSIKIATS